MTETRNPLTILSFHLPFPPWQVKDDRVLYCGRWRRYLNVPHDDHEWPGTEGAAVVYESPDDPLHATKPEPKLRCPGSGQKAIPLPGPTYIGSSVCPVCYVPSFALKDVLHEHDFQPSAYGPGDAPTVKGAVPAGRSLRQELTDLQAQLRGLEERRAELYQASLTAPSSEKLCPDSLAEFLAEKPSGFIQYPVTISGIAKREAAAWEPARSPGAWVAVRPASSPKTYLGVLVGEVALGAAVLFHPENGVLEVGFGHHNPAMWVPELRKVVFGAESWWRRLKKPEDLSDITDRDLSSVWYVRAMNELAGVSEAAWVEEQRQRVQALLVLNDLAEPQPEATRERFLRAVKSFEAIMPTKFEDEAATQPCGVNVDAEEVTVAHALLDGWGVAPGPLVQRLREARFGPADPGPDVEVPPEPGGKTYRGAVEGGACTVTVDGKPLELRLELANHSPTGFAWGYGGSGPAQLALAILSDCLGDDGQSLRLYQAFKADVIAYLPQGSPWRLSERSIRRWVALQGEAAREGTTKPCTCSSSPSPRPCSGQSNLGPGWRCVEGMP